MEKLNKTNILTILTAMFFLGVSATDIYIASLPQMVKDFNTTPTIVNFTLSCFSIGVASTVLFSAVLSSRFGRKTVILFGTGLFSVAAFIISVSPSIWLIIICRFAQSIGCSFIIIVSRMILKDIMDEREQIRANGIIVSGLVISPAIAPVIGAYLAHHFGWRSCFVFSGVIGTILSLISYWMMPETNSSPITKLPRLYRYLMGFFVLLKDRLLLGVIICYASAVAAFFAFIGISSYLYIEKLGVSPVTYSYVYILVAASYLAGNQYMLLMNKRKSSYSKIIGYGAWSSLIGASLLLLALPFSSKLIIVLVITTGIVFMRAANALINPTAQVLILNHYGSKGGNALGMLMCVNFCFSGIAVSLVTLFQSCPVTGLVIVSLSFSIVSALAFMLIKGTVNK